MSVAGRLIDPEVLVFGLRMDLHETIAAITDLQIRLIELGEKGELNADDDH